MDRFNHRRYQRDLSNAQQQSQMQQSTEKSVDNQTFGQEVSDSLHTYLAIFLENQYTFNPQESDFEPVDNCLASVLGQEVELTDEFKANYMTWLQREVYNTEIQWELLLDDVNQQRSQLII